MRLFVVSTAATVIHLTMQGGPKRTHIFSSPYDATAKDKL